MNKTQIVKDGTFDIIKSAVDKMVDLIKPTYGSAENKVIISKEMYGQWPLAVDDGVQIARDFKLDDPAENAIVNVIRETAVKTNDRVGDGTTSSLIILQAIISEVAKTTRRDGITISRDLKKGFEEIKNQLETSAIPIDSKEDLKKVAMISFNNEKVAEIIADIYSKIGKDGIITIDKSDTMETFSDMVDGIKIDKGYISPYMITNGERMESEILKPYILITDYNIVEAGDLIPIMDKMAKENKRELVVVCANMEKHALATAVVNKMQNKFLTIAVRVPSTSDNRVTLEDLAIITGAKFFSEGKGDKLEEVTIADLGRAEKFIARKEESVIVGPKGEEEKVNNLVINLKSAIANSTKERDLEDLKKRHAMATGKVAVIKVGAPTDNEMKSLRYKVEDAVNSVKSAYNHGVVCGAGLSLERLTCSSKVLTEAISAPARQLRDNLGVEEVVEKAGETAFATNYVTGERENWLTSGVVDPVEVLVAGLDSAVSIASILITSSGMIVEHPVDKKD